MSHLIFHDPNQTVIEFADDTQIDFYTPEVDEILQALLGHNQAMVSDLSSLWDFTPKEDTIARLETLLQRGISEENPLIWELARELRLLRTDQGLQPPRTNL